MQPYVIDKAVPGLLVLILILAAVLVAGCNDPNYVAPPYYRYTIDVKGLEHFYTDAGPACIGFPVPVYNGSALLPFEDNVTLDNSSKYSGYGDTVLRASGPRDEIFHGTRKVEATNISGRKLAVFEIVPTDYYTIGLIDAHTYPPNTTGIEYVSPYRPGNYTVYIIGKPGTTYDPLGAELRYDLGPDNKTARPFIDSLSIKPFLPAPGTPDAPYTRWLRAENISVDSVSSYTTCIYIDRTLKQKDSGNYSLDINAIFSITVGYRPHGYGPEEHYISIIRESIPGNVTGFVPVTVQCFGNVNSSDIYPMFGVHML